MHACMTTKLHACLDMLPKTGCISSKLQHGATTAVTKNAERLNTHESNEMHASH